MAKRVRSQQYKDWARVYMKQWRAKRKLIPLTQEEIEKKRQSCRDWYAKNGKEYEEAKRRKRGMEKQSKMPEQEIKNRAREFNRAWYAKYGKAYAEAKRRRLGMGPRRKADPKSASKRINTARCYRMKLGRHAEHNKNIENVLLDAKNRITYCTGIKHVLDHIVPISKGGYHHHLNLQILPKRINALKHNSLSWEMRPYLNHLDVPDYLRNRISDKSIAVSNLT